MRSLTLILSVTTALCATGAYAAMITPVSPAPQIIGTVIAGDSYQVTATGTIELCSTCNNGIPLTFDPNGISPNATGAYAPFASAPRDYDTSQSTTDYGYYGQGANLGELYGTFNINASNASDLFAIGYGTTFTAPATGTLYGVISDTDYGDNPASPTFSVTLAAAAVPEPASWLLMIAGFGAVGAALRRRRVAASIFFT